MLLPGPGTLHHRTRFALKQLHLAARIKFLAVAFDEFGFVIKRVALAGRAGHEQLHHALRSGVMMEAAVELGSWLRYVRKQAVLSEQMNHRDPAESAAEAPEKFTSINELSVFRAELNRGLLGRAGVARRIHLIDKHEFVAVKNETAKTG